MWTKKIPGCFGVSSLAFANHPADEQRAFQLLAELRAQQVDWTTSRREIKAFLTSKRASKAHVEAQMKRVALFFKPWL
jgi:hypothetical protein